MRTSQEEKAASDTKWATWVQQLQVEQALKQEKMAEDYARRFAEQDALCKELQQKMYVSEPVAVSKIVYPSQSMPLVTLSVPSQSQLSAPYRIPPALAPSVQVPPRVRPCAQSHLSPEVYQKVAAGAQVSPPLNPSDVLPQVQVMDLEQ